MMRRILETSVIIISTLGWWGFVYPELCLLETSYEETAADEAKGHWMWKQEQNAGTADKGYADFDVVITLPEEGAATGREVHIKSKIAEYVYQIRNREAEKDNQDDK